jgi:two-component system sensor histidine kinase QseC
LNDLFERLEAAFDRERRFSGNVAHELRTPLTELRTLCEVWLQYGPGEKHWENREAVVREVLEITDQMEGLVTSLTALVRSESGRERVRLEPADLTHMVRKAWQSFESPARTKSLSCEFDMPEESPVETDRNLMNGILVNLLSNAVAYTPGGGTIRCRLESGNGVFQFELENTSTGLRAEDVKHLSEPFWRGDSARTDGRHSGLGIPLALAYASLLGLDLEIDLPRPEAFRVRLRGQAR